MFSRTDGQTAGGDFRSLCEDRSTMAQTLNYQHVRRESAKPGRFHDDTGTSVDDPRGVSLPPNASCPSCGEDAFGVLMVVPGGYRAARPCRSCMHAARASPAGAAQAGDLHGSSWHHTIHLRRWRRAGHCRRQGLRRRPWRRRGRRLDRQRGAQARSDRRGIREPRPGRLRLRPSVFATGGLAKSLRLENPRRAGQGVAVTEGWGGRRALGCGRRAFGSRVARG